MTNGDVFDGSQVTFPKLLRKVGYETALIGKWHLKSDPTGFDRYEVLYAILLQPTDERDGKEIKRVGYTTDIITDLSLQWLKEERPRQALHANEPAQGSSWPVGTCSASFGRLG